MSKETNPVTSERSAATFKTSPESAQTSPAAQPRGSAEADQDRIAARAYELYEERGGKKAGPWKTG